MLFSFINALTFTEREQYIENLNIITYATLAKLAATDHYSKIKMNFYDKCPKPTENCGLECQVPIIKYKNQHGIIDLLNVPESYSPQIKNSANVWSDIYNINDDITFKNIVSGLQFSVTTHICSFHTYFFNIPIPNPLKFKIRYREEYKNQFFDLWLLIRSAVGNIKNIHPNIDSETMALSELITDDVVPVNLEIISDLKKTIEFIACLNCQKCILWGTIQTKGLISAVKILNNIKVEKNELIFLINLFRRLSETIKQSRRLYDIKYPELYLILVYYKRLLPTIAIILLTIYILIRRRIVIVVKN